MECLEARQLATALLNWHIEPEEKKDAQQKELVADLTAIVERSRYFMGWRHSLMQSIWYGRYAPANQFSLQRIRSKSRTVLRRFSSLWDYSDCADPIRRLAPPAWGCRPYRDLKPITANEHLAHAPG